MRAKVSREAGEIVEVNATGPCFEHVLSQISEENGVESARGVREQAAQLVEKCLVAYSGAFGRGDVGASSTGRVAIRFRPTSDLPIGRGTNGLLYGKVQSGKTNLTIASGALAYANGFRLFVVLTSDNTWLGKQTFSRFRDALQVDGPVVIEWENWRRDPGRLGKSYREQVEDVGLLLVCTKNVKNLDGLLTVLRSAEAGRVPALIIDDEADNASLNTRESKQLDEPSKVFARIGAIRSVIPNHVYLQVTATPQSLLLQTIDHPLRPAFAITSEPGSDYVGGDLFFDAHSPYVHVVDATELEDLRSGKINPGNAWTMPSGLRLAICCFVLGAAYKMHMDRSARAIYSMLVHICHKKLSHEAIATTIREFIRDFDKALRGRSGDRKKSQAERWLNDARNELEKTAKNLPAQGELLELLKLRLRNAAPEIINADNPRQEPEYRPGMNILVGGNRLGRGVTIKGLMVTYYGRDAKQKMTDTVHQHARMFGYRRTLLDVTRLFSARHIVDVFRDIHESDEGTRAVVAEAGSILDVKPVWVGEKLKPTRSNVLNPAAIGTLVPGKAIFSPRPRYRRADIANHTKTLDRLTERYADGRFHTVELQFITELLEHLPSDPVEGYSWEDRRVRQALLALGKEPVGIKHARLQVLKGQRGEGRSIARSVTAGDYLQSSGYLSGPETTQARSEAAENRPVLVLSYQQGRKRDDWDDQPFYAPTLVLPATRFAFMFAYE